MLKKANSIIFLITILALVLRFIGIAHGYPFIFHADEPTIIRSALGIRFFPNPKHFDWPHLYIYLNYLVYMGFAYLRDLATQLGYKSILVTKLPVLWNDDFIFYLLTRIITATLGALTTIPVYLTAKKLFQEKVGVLAAFTFAILPFHIWQSHFALPDVPMLFLLAWGIYYAAHLLTDSDPADYARSGFFVGLSASTKYNGALGAIMVPWAHFLRILSSRLFPGGYKEPWLSVKGVFNLVAAAFLAILAFVLGTPYAVLDYKTFIRTDGPAGALWQFTNVGAIPFWMRFGKFYTQMTQSIPADLGYIVLIGYFLCIGLCVARFMFKRYTKNDLSLLFLIVPSLLFLIYISGFEKSRSHYYLITYPFIAIVFAYFVYYFYSLLQRKGKLLAPVFLITVFMPVLYFAYLNVATFYRNDTRLTLYTWEQNYLGPTDVVFYDANELKPAIDQAPGVIYKGIRPVDTTGRMFYITVFGAKPTANSVQILYISNDSRLGPHIKVFKYSL